MEWVGGLLVEDTIDYFAQDTDGNVWYLEEETVDIEYDDDGNEIGRDPGGSWLHGVNNAQATCIMPANRDGRPRLLQRVRAGRRGAGRVGDPLDRRDDHRRRPARSTTS